MGKVTREQIEQLAALAHLSLTEEEVESLSADLEQILGYAERIQRLDTDDVPPTSHALLAAGSAGGETALRDDEPRPGLDRKKALEGAPDDGDGLFKVPKVLPS